MNEAIRHDLIDISKDKMFKNDPSHDINHMLRVLSLSEKIAKAENADLDIIIPAAIFHDVICYPKNHNNRARSSVDSAKFARKVLNRTDGFPKDKINRVYDSIESCSFSKGIVPNFLEAKILQDADGLEATGAIAIMRTFSSAGVMNMDFYNIADPFCKSREPNSLQYALDLFFIRLLVIHKKLHSKTAIRIAKRRMKFLRTFLNELKLELSESL